MDSTIVHEIKVKSTSSSAAYDMRGAWTLTHALFSCHGPLTYVTHPPLSCHAVIASSWTGCSLPGSTMSCDTVLQVATHPTDRYTCRMSLPFHNGTALMDVSMLSLTIPSYASFQALSFEYVQGEHGIMLPSSAVGNHAIIEASHYHERMVRDGGAWMHIA